MKATLEFDLPAEQEEFAMAVESMQYKVAIADILEILRREIKYTDYPERTEELLIKIRNDIYDRLADYGIKI